VRRVSQRTIQLPGKPKAEGPKPSAPKKRDDAFTAELDLTGWRGLAKSVEEARADFDTPLMKQFLTDLRAEAARRNVTVENVEQQLGRWKDGLEPSLKVQVRDGREGVLKLAATMGKNYNQDAVLVLSQGSNATVYDVTLPPHVSREAAAKLLDANGLPGSTSSLDGRHLTLVALGRDEPHVKAFLDSMEGEVVATQKRGADFIDRRAYAQVLALEEKPHTPAPYDVHFPVGGLTKR
jgi:hypothetical protein